MQTKEIYSDATGYVLTPGQKFYRWVKAVADFFIGLVAVLVLSPVFLIVAIAIKLDSPGPVFFKQKRIGYQGKTFTCIKFRSMSTEAAPSVASAQLENVDQYITKVGRFIRKYSIDELPQLFTLLTGQMSLIGYRASLVNEPELIEARERYGLYQTRPGISGWAQVNGRDVLGAQPKKKAQYDNYYMQNISLWLDIKIFFMTIVKVIACDDVLEGTSGAEAVAEVEQEQEEKEMELV